MSFVRLVSLVIAFACCSTWLEPPCAAQDNAAAVAAPEGQAEAEEPLDDKTKKEWAASAVMMLAGVVFLGVVLLVLVIRWGYVARKLARQPLPPTNRGDELWYLKPPKEPVEQQESDTRNEKDSPDVS